MSNNRELGYVVGAVAGYFTGGASYVALGATVGGVVGGLLDPKVRNEGPRLDDLKVQQSTYGVGIPRLYGTERFANNVVWSTDKLETSTTTEAGKGGGAENTSYRYYVQMRLLLCETPADDSEVQIAQIFADGKLQWDARSGVSVDAALASAENPYAFFTLYQGHADQLPDPVEELYEDGPGSVPAYRGVVSISMKGIECPGGRVPQFSFVLSRGATVGDERFDFAEGPASGDAGVAWAVIRQDTAWHYTQFGNDFDGDYGLKVTKIGLNYQAPQPDIPAPGGVHYGLNPIPASGDGDPVVLRVRCDTVGAPLGVPWHIEKYNLSTAQVATMFTYVPLSNAELRTPKSAGYEYATDKYVFVGGGDDHTNNVSIIHGASEVVTEAAPGAVGAVTIRSNTVYALSQVSGILVVTTFNGDTGELIDTFNGPANSDSAIAWAALHPGGDNLYVWCRNGLEYNAYSVDYESGTWTLLSTNVNTAPTEKLGSQPTTFFSDTRRAIIGPSSEVDLVHNYSFITFNSVDLAGALVSDIIAAECEKVGETRYNVSEIPDEDVVAGYKIGAPASARANIDPLLSAFQIFIVDEDGAIKFKKYSGITSVATIAYDELGQADDEAEPGDPMPLVRAQEVDMPLSVSVSYIEPLNDYQVATEKEIRQVTEANEDVLVQLPVALSSSDQAKKAASNILYSTWRSQNRRSCRLARKYAFLSPGDGVTIEYPQGTSRLWRITRYSDSGSLIELDLEPGDANIYTQEAKGATGYVGQSIGLLPPPTQVTILDTPILRDADNNAGIYVALAGQGPNWHGGELLVGPDESTVTPRGTVSNESPFGYSVDTLGDWDVNIVDESNVLTVNVGSTFTLSSISRSVLLTGDQNVAAVGVNGRWEILKFQRASSLGGGLYALTGLMRGLRGTEWARSLHQSNDTFAVMSIAGMLRPNMSAGEIGLEQVYQAYSAGRSTSTATTKRYANTAEGLEPFSPTNLVKDYDGDDITLSWVRRTRLSENWLNGIVPLGESSERWQVAIYSDDTFSTLVRIIPSTTNNAVYTGAQQVSDFGSLQDEISLRISQISDVVGPGHELEVTR